MSNFSNPSGHGGRDIDPELTAHDEEALDLLKRCQLGPDDEPFIDTRLSDDDLQAYYRLRLRSRLNGHRHTDAFDADSI